MPIHIGRDDTPPGHVLRIHPDGCEELIRFDWAAAARTRGAWALPSLWIIAGPNGAGKTTLVSRRLASHLPAINPAEIAFDLPRVPNSDLLRRFPVSLLNLAIAVPLADRTLSSTTAASNVAYC